MLPVRQGSRYVTPKFGKSHPSTTVQETKKHK